MKLLCRNSVAAAAVAALVGTASAATDKQCQQYAKDAVFQYKMMTSYPGCKLKTSNRWHSGFRRHYDWCRTADMQAVNAETLKRENHLISCGAVQDGMNPIGN